MRRRIRFVRKNFYGPSAKGSAIDDRTLFTVEKRSGARPSTNAAGATPGALGRLKAENPGSLPPRFSAFSTVTFPRIWGPYLFAAEQIAFV